MQTASWWQSLLPPISPGKTAKLVYSAVLLRTSAFPGGVDPPRWPPVRFIYMTVHESAPP